MYTGAPREMCRDVYSIVTASNWKQPEYSSTNRRKGKYIMASSYSRDYSTMKTNHSDTKPGWISETMT